MIRLFAGIAAGVLVLVTLCAEIIAAGYYFAWVYTIQNGSIQVGFGVAGAVAILTVGATTIIGGIALVSLASDA